MIVLRNVASACLSLALVAGIAFAEDESHGMAPGNAQGTPDQNGRPTASDLSPDGKVLALGLRPDPAKQGDAAVRLVELATAKELRRIALKGEAGTIVFSPDGKRLACACARWKENDVRVLDAHTGAEIKTLDANEGHAFSMTFSQDGKRLVVAGVGPRIRIWDVEHGKLLRAIETNAKSVFCVALSPDGKTVASVTDEDPVRLWDAEAGTELRRIVGVGRLQSVCGVAFSPDGTKLVWSSILSGVGSFHHPSTIHLVNVETGAEIDHVEERDGVTGRIRFHDASTITLGGQEGTIYWDTAKQIESRIPASGHLLPDGKTLVAPGIASKLGLPWIFFSVPGGTPRRTLAEAPRKPFRHDELTVSGGGVVETILGPVAFSPDGKLMASSGTDRLRLWDLATGRQIGERVLEHRNIGGTYPAGILAFSPDSTLLAVSDPGELSFHGVPDLAPRKLFSLTKLADRSGPARHLDPRAIAFSPDGTLVAVGGAEGAYLCDLNAVKVGPGGIGTGKSEPLPSETTTVSSVSSLAFQPDGKALALGGTSWALLDLAKKEPLLRGEGAEACDHVSFMPDGTLVLSVVPSKGGMQWKDRVLRFVDGTGKVQRTIPGGYHLVPGGKQVVVLGTPDRANEKFSVRIADASTGKEGLPLACEWHPGDSFHESPDGKLIAIGRRAASGKPDPCVRVCSLETGKELVRTGAPAGE